MSAAFSIAKNSSVYDPAEMGLIKNSRADAVGDEDTGVGQDADQKKKSSLVRTETIKDAVDMITGGEYSINRRAACQMMKVTVAYWGKNVHDLIPYVSLRGVAKASTEKGYVVSYGPDYIQNAGIPSGYFHYSEEEFRRFVFDHLKISRRTKHLYLDDYVSDKAAWQAAAKKLNAKRPNQLDYPNYRKFRFAWIEWRERCTEEFRKYLPEQLHFLLDKRIGYDNRSSQWVEISLADCCRSHENRQSSDLELRNKLKNYLWEKMIAKKWISPSGDCDYGETPVEIYRRIHAAGDLRLDIIFENAKGETKKITRYIEDPMLTVNPDALFECTVEWDSWLKLNEILNEL